jgi:hypothetical protein
MLADSRARESLAVVGESVRLYRIDAPTHRERCRAARSRDDDSVGTGNDRDRARAAALCARRRATATVRLGFRARHEDVSRHLQPFDWRDVREQQAFGPLTSVQDDQEPVAALADDLRVGHQSAPPTSSATSHSPAAWICPGLDCRLRGNACRDCLGERSGSCSSGPVRSSDTELNPHMCSETPGQRLERGMWVCVAARRTRRHMRRVVTRLLAAGIIGGAVLPEASLVSRSRADPPRSRASLRFRI